jgi:N-acyl-D-amino-acid deacylase
MSHRVKPKRLVPTALVIATVLCALLFPINSEPVAAAQKKSVVIVGATIIDGTGRPGFRATVRIEDDRIVTVGRFKPRRLEEVIDASGMVLAPGFIDIHNHSTEGLFREPAAPTQVSQGITTLVVGADGDSPWPLADYFAKLAKQHVAVNVMSFVGHATVRERAMGSDWNRAATAKEIAAMAKLVDQGMNDGAVGLSTGLEYDIGMKSTTEEVIELARVAAKRNGIYMSHVRDEADLVMSAFAEAISIGREASIPVQISHIKVGTVSVWGQAGKAVAMIEEARRAGVDVTADCYPYDAWHSTITVLIPSRRHDDPVAVKQGLDDVGGAANILIASCAAHRDFEGKTLEVVAREKGITPVEAYMLIVRDKGASIVCRSMTEGDIKTFYQQPWVMVSSDGGVGSRHPRGAGTFTKVLGRFAREHRWFSLEEAVRKMTSMPAARLGLRDRGVIRQGMKADLVIFDPKRITDRSTFKEPELVSEGVSRVFVNGAVVWSDGKTSGQLPGSVIRKNL